MSSSIERSTPMDREDLALLADLVDIYDALDPMPEMLPEVVLFGLGATDLDAEIARLVESDRSVAGTRGSLSPVEHARRITFSSDHLSVMIAIEPVGADAVRLDGWVAPGGGLRVELRSGERLLTTTCDTSGRFAFDRVPAGPAQLVLHPTEASDATVTVPVVTPAIEL